LEKNPTYEEAVKIGAEWKKLGGQLNHLKKENKIALLVDNRSLTALKWYPIDRDLSYNDVVRWMYDSLYEMNLECDVVDVQAIEPSKYDMIVTPALYCVDDELIGKLDSFVKNGGVLVSSFKSFFANRQVTVYEDAQPHGLTQCFGMSYNQFSNPERTTLNGKPVKYFMEFLKPQGAKALANYEHKYWGEYAAITKNTYGKGTAYYIGCFTDKEQLKQIYKEAAADAKIENDFGQMCFPLIVRSGKAKDGSSLHYVMNYSEEAKTVVCPYSKAEDLLTGTCYVKGDVITLQDWGLAIIKN
jgi:beta-galactosidase